MEEKTPGSEPIAAAGLHGDSQFHIKNAPQQQGILPTN
jgi:hypothetical protein